jgi:purine catabolism regulator
VAEDDFSRCASGVAASADPPVAFGKGGSAVDAGTLCGARVRALAALGSAAPGGVNAGARLSAAQLMAGFTAPEAADVFRQQILGPLESWDASHQTELVHTLRVFLAQDGRWRESARLLHIHHNTLKNRLERIRLLTGLDADKTGDRADLWLAIAARR